MCKTLILLQGMKALQSYEPLNVVLKQHQECNMLYSETYLVLAKILIEVLKHDLEMTKNGYNYNIAVCFFDNIVQMSVRSTIAFDVI